MYTRCPSCSTAFSVTAAQLRAGHGQVRCGSCLSVFDGLEYLEDPVPSSRWNVRTRGPAPHAGGAAEIGRARGREHPEETGSSSSSSMVAADAVNEATDAQPLEHDTALPVLEAAQTPPEREEVPEVIQADMARVAEMGGARKRRIGFSVACAVLALLLAGQYVWFHPDDVLRIYPTSRAWIESLCSYTGCALPERRDPSRVRLVSRDVRAHPEYEGALQIAATMVNTVPHPQPFPRMQFTLFNVNGQVIATRTFTPREYLAEDLSAHKDMPSRKPVQIVLDVLALEEAAVSFEFQFL